MMVMSTGTRLSVFAASSPPKPAPIITTSGRRCAIGAAFVMRLKVCLRLASAQTFLRRTTVAASRSEAIRCMVCALLSYIFRNAGAALNNRIRTSHAGQIDSTHRGVHHEIAPDCSSPGYAPLWCDDQKASRDPPQRSWNLLTGGGAKARDRAMDPRPLQRIDQFGARPVARGGGRH